MGDGSIIYSQPKSRLNTPGLAWPIPVQNETAGPALSGLIRRFQERLRGHHRFGFSPSAGSMIGGMLLLAELSDVTEFKPSPGPTIRGALPVEMDPLL